MEVRSSDRLDAASESLRLPFTRFRGRYAANFGKKLQGDDETAEWVGFVDSCDIDVLLESLDIIAESWKPGIDKPTLPVVRRAYNALFEKRAAMSPREPFHCRKCGNQGAVWLVFYELGFRMGRSGVIHEKPYDGGILKMINGVRSCVVHPSHRHPVAAGRLKMAPVPCVCGFGRQYGKRKNGEDIFPDADYWEWGFKEHIDAGQYINPDPGYEYGCGGSHPGVFSTTPININEKGQAA